MLLIIFASTTKPITMGKDSNFTGQPVYNQVLNLLNREKIIQISLETKGSEAYVKRFDGYQHLVVMLFGILKHFDSLRELEIGMKAEAHKLPHLGLDYLVRRSTLAEANIRRPQEFFASVYAYLLEYRLDSFHVHLTYQKLQQPQ